jgi:hypothetical protein
MPHRGAEEAYQNQSAARECAQPTASTKWWRRHAPREILRASDPSGGSFLPTAKRISTYDEQEVGLHRLDVFVEDTIVVDLCPWPPSRRQGPVSARHGARRRGVGLAGRLPFCATPTSTEAKRPRHKRLFRITEGNVTALCATMALRALYTHRTELISNRNPGQERVATSEYPLGGCDHRAGIPDAREAAMSGACR